MAIIVADEKTHISTNTTTQIVVGPCKLKNIVVNTTAAGTITIVDSAASGTSTPVVGILKASVAEGTYIYNCAMAHGLQIITAGASDITVTWNI